MLRCAVVPYNGARQLKKFWPAGRRIPYPSGYVKAQADKMISEGFLHGRSVSIPLCRKDLDLCHASGRPVTTYISPSSFEACVCPGLHFFDYRHLESRHNLGTRHVVKKQSPDAIFQIRTSQYLGFGDQYPWLADLVRSPNVLPRTVFTQLKEQAMAFSDICIYRVQRPLSLCVLLFPLFAVRTAMSVMIPTTVPLW